MIAPARQSFMTHLRVSWVERALMRHLARRRVPARAIARAFGRRHMTVLAHVRDVQRRRPHWTAAQKRRYARERRARLATAGDCITSAAHGKATHGRLCGLCREVHSRSA